MGADIHSFAEVRKDGKWVIVNDVDFGTERWPTNSPFDWRGYGMFGFLADVRRMKVALTRAR